MAVAPVLQSLRVVDLCDEKGTYCGKLLADLGADVVLVEPPGGSTMRRIGPFLPDVRLHSEDHVGNESLFFRHYNNAKRIIVLDLDAESGRRALLDLIRAADVIIDSFAPSYLTSRRLDDPHLKPVNPRLIRASITPFGRTGPYRDFRICDLVAQAMGGLVYVNGWSDGSPLQGLGLQAYHSAGVCAATAVLLALLSRERSGRGRSVDVSIHAAAAAVLEHATSLFREDATIARRNGSLHWTRAFRIGPCRDGFVSHSTFGDWTTLAQWVVGEQPESVLAESPWEDRGYRAEHAEELFAALDDWAGDRAADHLAEDAQLRRLPYAALARLESLPSHPQLRARHFFVPHRSPSTSTTLLHAGPPYALSPSPVVSAGATRAADDPHMPPLAGVRVVDFTWAVAGPLATRILADYGAEVIKIEPPDLVSDPRRKRVLIAGLNRGKQSIAIDMTKTRALELVGLLIARSHVVIDNFSPRVMVNWGLDDEHLRRLQPSIISISMSGFGATGPYRDRVSYGPTLQAAAGHSLMMQDSEGKPVGWGFSYSDMIAGRTAALAVVAAIRRQRESGQGCRIDMSQFESLIAATGPLVLWSWRSPSPGKGRAAAHLPRRRPHHRSAISRLAPRPIQ